MSIVEFGSGLINFNSSLLSTLIEEEFRILISRLLHSDIHYSTAGKKESLKKILTDLKTRDFAALRTSCSIGVIVW